jgi:hypothetical protein
MFHYGFGFRDAPVPLQRWLIENGQNVFKNRLKTCFQTFPVSKHATAGHVGYLSGITLVGYMNIAVLLVIGSIGLL